MGDEFNKFGEWEDAWQQAFEGSEQAPPRKVWQGLENSLMEQQLGRYRRKLFIYQRLAAASVLLLGFWAGWWLLFAQPSAQQRQTDSQQQQTVADQAPATGPEAAEPASGRDAALGGSSLSAKQPGVGPSVAAQKNLAEGASPERRGGQRKAVATGSFSAGSVQKGFYVLNEAVPLTDSLQFYAAQLQVLSDRISALQLEKAAAELLLAAHDPQAEVKGLKAILALEDGKVERELRVVATRSKRKNNKYNSPNGSTWLGASLASSYFNPNLGMSASNSLSWTAEPVAAKGGKVYSANASEWNEKEASLPSINISLDAAFRIGQRWILQSSLEYGTYKVGAISGTYTDQQSKIAYPLYFTNFSYDKLQVVSQNSRKAAPVNALNTYRFVSVPVVFNYVLLERRIGFSLGTGISTDVFLGGQIQDQERRLETYEIEAGEDSPFNRLHFNALVGAQLFYRAGPAHLFTIEPTYKHALSNFNKHNSFFESRPTQFGVAVGFRYILQ